MIQLKDKEYSHEEIAKILRSELRKIKGTVRQNNLVAFCAEHDLEISHVSGFLHEKINSPTLIKKIAKAFGYNLTVHKKYTFEVHPSDEAPEKTKSRK